MPARGRRGKAPWSGDAPEGRRPCVAVIEDDEAIARLFVRTLTTAGLAVVGAAASGEQGVPLVRERRPDVALVGLNLPRMSGEATIRAIRRASPATACIVVTAVDVPARVVAALRAGARGYLLKPFRAAALPEAVLQVLRGEAPLDGRVARILVDEIRAGRLRRARA